MKYGEVKNGANMTVENFQKIKEYVLILGGFDNTQKLDVQIEMIINEILAYCYRNDIPSNMELPVADVIVTELNKQGTISGFDGTVTSYREGDMSVTFADATKTGAASVKYNGKLEGFKLVIGATRCSGG